MSGIQVFNLDDLCDELRREADEDEARDIQHVRALFVEVATIAVRHGMERWQSEDAGWLVSELLTALFGPQASIAPAAPADTQKRRTEPCVWCGSADEPNWDHIIPRSRRGSNHASNRRWLCGPCNRFKGNLLDEEISAATMKAHLERRQQEQGPRP